MTQRIEHDAYLTKMASQLVPPAVEPLDRIFNLSTKTILEPCAGDRDIVKAMQEMCINARFISSDLQDRDNMFFTHTDATTQEYWDQKFLYPEIDLVISNLPFNVAHEIIPKAYAKAKIGVVFMLRLTYIEPTCSAKDESKHRLPWLEEHKGAFRNLTVVSPRPQFIQGKKGSDSVTVAWCTWLKPKYYAQSLNHLHDYPFYTPLGNWKNND